MVKIHDVMQYLKDGINENVACNEEITYVDAEYSNEQTDSFEVEFTDYGSNLDKTKYRVTVESID